MTSRKWLVKRPTTTKRWLAALGRLPRARILTWSLGVLVTAWFLPVLGHQWQDRQRAHELQAELITKIGRATTDALVTSQVMVSGRLPHTIAGGFNPETFNQIDLDWQQSRAEIEAQIKAYFPNSDLSRVWNDYAEFVRNTYWLATDRCHLREATVMRIRKRMHTVAANNKKRRLGVQLSPEQKKAQKKARKKLQKELDLLRNPFAINNVPRCTDNPTHRILTKYTLAKHRLAREGYYIAARTVLEQKDEVMSRILRGHPAGFSTTSSDLLDDLFPWR